jgi:pyruvate dehydrogenase E1 component alpha subunit
MRIRGHSEHDDASYVPKAMLEVWRAKDPVRQHEARLREWGFLDDTADAEMTRRIVNELESAVAWAEASPFPEAKDVEQGVYSS